MSCAEKDVYLDVTENTKVEGFFEAYLVSKIITDNAVWAWFDEHPSAPFDAVAIGPGFTFGRNLLQTDRKINFSNQTLWSILTTGLPGFPDRGVHVSDVSLAHIRSLDAEKVKGKSRLFVVPPSIGTWKDALEYTKKKWPERTWAKAETPAVPVKLDASATYEALGINWRSIEEQIDDFVQGQLAFEE